MAKIRLNKLSIKDYPVFAHFLQKTGHKLSTYHFANIFIWKTLFTIEWSIINNRLCIFFKDKLGCFMYLPPLNGLPIQETLNTCFRIMDDTNSNPNVSRIENVEDKDLSGFTKLKYKNYTKPADYVYLRKDICGLKGNPYKSQRWVYNFFMRNNKTELCKFGIKDREEAIELCTTWKEKRKCGSSEKLYHWMIEDNYLAQKEAIKNFHKIGLEGYKVTLKNKLCAYTLGFSLNKQTFCVLFETCDLSYKGLSAFIFREFCRQLQKYKYINVTDDSGLERLRRIKLHYHPQGIIANHIIQR